LREFAKSKGWDTVEFVERASGGSHRPIFQDMLGRAMMFEFKGILVYSLDRFSREGILDTLSYIRKLKQRGIWVKSLREEWMDTESDFAELMLAQFSWFAQFERKKISDRTKAGLARRKALGVQLGRPRCCPLCGWSHKPTKQCKTPPKIKAHPIAKVENLGAN
jgi:DNA invertase Pin-like site-specific DNA recombinase